MFDFFYSIIFSVISTYIICRVILKKLKINSKKIEMNNSQRDGIIFIILSLNIFILILLINLFGNLFLPI